MDHFAELLAYADGLEEGERVGNTVELRNGTPKALAELAPRIYEHLGIAKRARHRVLLRTDKKVPALRDIRWAPTHIYNVKFMRVGKQRVYYTKCRAGRLDKKLRRLASFEDVRILGVSESWMAPWTPANRELERLGIPRYRQVD